AFVHQEFETLTGRKLAALVLGLNAPFTAASARAGAPPFEVFANVFHLRLRPVRQRLKSGYAYLSANPVSRASVIAKTKPDRPRRFIATQRGPKMILRVTRYRCEIAAAGTDLPQTGFFSDVIGHSGERWESGNPFAKIFLIGHVGIQQEEALYVWTLRRHVWTPLPRQARCRNWR